MKQAFKLILILIWMSIIFYFSSRTGVESEQQSQFVKSLFELIGIKLDTLFGQFDDLIVRKTAHFTVYLILTLLVYNYIKDKVKSPYSYFFALFITFLYAGSDEIHQAFVPLRGSRFTDVLIDTFGGVVALSLIKLNSLRKQKKV